jgi:tetratricopeptide (TPR) repeat protein
MRIHNLSILLAVALSFSAFMPGCSTSKKVRSTLATNQVLVQAGAAEDDGDYEKAYQLWTDFVERRPHEAFGEYRLGRIENRLGKHSDAVRHLSIAHDLKPGNIEYIEELAVAYSASGQQDELLSMLNATVDEGEDGSGYLRLAHHAAKVGMMDEAHEALIAAVTIHGAVSAKPHLALADFARDIGDAEVEITALRHALWFDPSDSTILDRIRELGLIPGPSIALDPR